MQGARGQGAGEKNNSNCERSELSSLFNGTDFSIYIFQAVRRAVNVLNVSTCI